MLEVLKDINYIGDRPIKRVRYCGRRSHDIEMNMRTDEIHFKIRLQNSPRSVVGDQGLDPDHIIILARELIKGLNQQLPCKENELTIECLNDAIQWQLERRRRRIEQGIEGMAKEKNGKD